MQQLIRDTNIVLSLGAAMYVRRCVLMCHAPRKEYYKKFLYEAFPVESHLDAALADHMAAEVSQLLSSFWRL